MTDRILRDSEFEGKTSPVPAPRILMIPARRNIGANPYTALMCDALESAGYVVEDLAVMPELAAPQRSPATGRARPRSALRAWRAAVTASLAARYDIIHLHWPHAFAQDFSYPVAVARSACLVGMLAVHRLRGARVVWTVHDVDPMVTRGRRRLLTATMIAATLGMVNGLVFLSGTSMTTFGRKHPSAARKPSVLARHAVYGERVPAADRAAARAWLGLPRERAVIGFLGDIRDYKGLDDLLEACPGLGADGPVTLIAGAARSPEAAAVLEERIALLQQQGLPVRWTHRARLTDDELATVLAACDLVVLPYRIAWNSGLAVLALEHSRRVLCRDQPVFRELRRELSEQWVRVYTPPLIPATLLEAVSHASNLAESSASIPQNFIDRRQWGTVIADVIDLYHRL